MIKYSAMIQGDKVIVTIDIKNIDGLKYSESRSDINVFLNFDKPRTEFYIKKAIKFKDMKNLQYRKQPSFKITLPEGYIIITKALYKKEYIKPYILETSDVKYRGGIYTSTNISRPYAGGAVSPR